MKTVPPIFRADTYTNVNVLVPIVRIVEADIDGLYQPLHCSSQEFDLMVGSTKRHFYPYLKNISNIKESIDMLNMLDKRKWKNSSVKMRIENFQYPGIDEETFEEKNEPFEYFSDRLSKNAMSKFAVHVRLKSQGATAWSDCLEVYKGRIRSIDQNENDLTITVEDESSIKFKELLLPVNRLGDDQDVADSFKNKPIPMVYGRAHRVPTVQSFTDTVNYLPEYTSEKSLTIHADSRPLKSFGSFNFDIETDGYWNTRTPLQIKAGNDTYAWVANFHTLNFNDNLDAPVDQDYVQTYYRNQFGNVQLLSLGERGALNENEEPTIVRALNPIIDGLLEVWVRRKFTTVFNPEEQNGFISGGYYDRCIDGIRKDEDWLASTTPGDEAFLTNPYTYLEGHLLETSGQRIMKMTFQLDGNISLPTVAVSTYFQTCMNFEVDDDAYVGDATLINIVSAEFGEGAYGFTGSQDAAGAWFWGTTNVPAYGPEIITDDNYTWKDLDSYYTQSWSSYVVGWQNSVSWLIENQAERHRFNHLVGTTPGVKDWRYSLTQFSKINWYIIGGGPGSDAGSLDFLLKIGQIGIFHKCLINMENLDYFIDCYGRVDTEDGIYTGISDDELRTSQGLLPITDGDDRDRRVTFDYSINPDLWVAKTGYGGYDAVFSLTDGDYAEEFQGQTVLRSTDEAYEFLGFSMFSYAFLEDEYDITPVDLTEHSITISVMPYETWGDQPDKIYIFWGSDTLQYNFDGGYFYWVMGGQNFWKEIDPNTLTPGVWNDIVIDSTYDDIGDPFYEIWNGPTPSLDNINKLHICFVRDGAPTTPTGFILGPLTYSGTFPGMIYGCTDSDADNYNPDATIDDGTCEYSAYDPVAVISNITVNGEEWDGGNLHDGDLVTMGHSESFDEDGEILLVEWAQTVGNTQSLSFYSEIVPIDPVFFTVDALIVSSPLTFALQVFDLDGNPSELATQSFIMYVEPIVEGCMDPIATNYNSDATIDDGSCIYDYPEEDYWLEDATNLIENPADVLYHIVGNEAGLSALGDWWGDMSEYGPFDTDSIRRARVNHNFYQDYTNHSGAVIPAGSQWKWAFSIYEEDNLQSILEKLSTNSMLFPYFGSDGNFKLITLRSTYHAMLSEDIDMYFHKIKLDDIMKYKLKRTSMDDVYTNVTVAHNYSYGYDNYLRDTGTKHWNELPRILINDPDADLLDFYNFSSDAQTETHLNFSADYIVDTATAKALRDFLLGWHMNQHTLLSITLPLKYMKYEIGDIMYLPDLIQDKKAYGEDYSFSKLQRDGEYVTRNGQVIFPLWMIYDTVKSTKEVKISLIQLHDWTGGVDRDMSFSPPSETDADFNINNNSPSDVIPESVGLTGLLASTFFSFTNTTEHEIESTEWEFGDGQAISTEELTINHSYNYNDLNDYLDEDLNDASWPVYIDVTMTSNAVSGESVTTTKNIALYKTGDTNGDGSMDILDVVMVIGLLMSTSDLNDIQLFRTDCNGDGAVNILDVVMQVNEILNQ